MNTTTGSPAPESDTGLAPVTGKAPYLLILGSFPSRRSLQNAEYYGNPLNQFWKIIEALYGIDHRLAYPKRTGQLIVQHIALWDVIASCQREGSADNRIHDPVFNDIAGFLRAHPSCRCIALNGASAGRYYHARKDLSLDRIPAHIFPSSSPANARFSLAEKIHRWEEICHVCSKKG
jgi:double-stranded uracil-DNA glycosylase